MHLRYLDLLARELEIRSKSYDSKPHTLYLGGGTPSELDRDCLQSLFGILADGGVLHHSLAEFTMECNPETTTADRILTMQQAGVSRVSLGVQSFDAKLLETIGRKAYPHEAREALKMLVSQGFLVSGDLMFCLPGQSVNGFLDDLCELVNAGVGHVSFYGLSIEKRTLFGQWVRKGRVDADDDRYGDFYRMGAEFLASQGFARYEVSNFARIGQEGIHNSRYWKRGEYLGLGPGAHSFVGHIRYGSPRSFARWQDWVEAGCPEAGQELDILGAEQERIEWIWLGLRQACGIDLHAFAGAGHGIIKASICETYVQKGWVSCQNDVLKIVGEGWNYIDKIVADIVEQAQWP